jgi:hypothetical protein
MPKHHVIISGTGRAGTTFLVQLMTVLQLDTGFDSPTSAIFPNCNAGMEFDIRQPNAPYLIKGPRLCDQLDEVVRSGQIVIDHAIIPMRDLYSAAQSRIAVSEKAGPTAHPVPGGLWHTKVPDQQQAVLTQQLYKLIEAIANHDIPVTLLYFPRLVNDPEYLYQKLRFLFPEIGYDAFLQAFRAVSKPELVHDFKKEES